MGVHEDIIMEDGRGEMDDVMIVTQLLLDDRVGAGLLYPFIIEWYSI